MNDVDSVRATAVEAGRRAGAQASKFATHGDEPVRTGAAYRAWRTELILQHRIGLDELIGHWISWKKDRDRYVFLTELGFDDPAGLDLQASLEAMITLAEADLRRLALDLKDPR